MKHDEATAQPAPLGQVERGVGRPEPERAADGVWRVDRWACRGPCWNGYWTVSRELPPGVAENALNDAGKLKRFRSEAAARRVAARLNREGV